MSIEDLGPLVERLSFATIDHLRPVTQGHQEVIFCPGKTPAQVVAIAERLKGTFLATRVETPHREALVARFPRAEVNELGRTVFLAPEPEPAPTGRGTILVVTAGTSDLPVAEEAAVTARALRNRVERLTDVGVAGLHRILSQTDVLRNATVIIVVAGMGGGGRRARRRGRGGGRGGGSRRRAWGRGPAGGGAHTPAPPPIPAGGGGGRGGGVGAGVWGGNGGRGGAPAPRGGGGRERE